MFTTSEFYQKMDSSNSDDDRDQSKVIDIEVDLEKIKDIINDFVNTKIDMDIDDTYGEYNMVYLYDNELTNRKFKIFITKLKDEWYRFTYYEYESKNSKAFKFCEYKCDGWGGLVRCLKDINLLK